MKYAVISDIHSNLEALTAVLDSIKAEGIDNIVCVGDVVGYGANPVETTEIIRELGCKCVLGNHDAAAIGKTDITYFNSAARTAALWTGKQLDETGRNYLLGLPLVERIEVFTIVHSSLDTPESWNYVYNIIEAEEHFQYQKDSISFIGHSHIPGAFMLKDTVQPIRSVKFRIQSGTKYLVNVGSVGQPRDNIPDSCYVIYNMYEGVIEFKRVPYDIKAAQKKIINAGLPEVLSSRLSIGR